MRGQDILRTLLFVIFFSVGAAALSGAVLFGDLLSYCENKELLDSSEESLEKLRSLNADYDALLKQVQEEPELIDRIARATFGTGPEDANTAYPKVAPEQLDAARRALMEATQQRRPVSVARRWVERLSRPWRRVAVFLCGAALVLVSFMFFSSKR